MSDRIREGVNAWNKWKGYIWSAIPNRDWELIAQGLGAALIAVAELERLAAHDSNDHRINHDDERRDRFG